MLLQKIIVGISGGVDSAVTALLLRNRGYNVIGVFMKNWDEFDELGKCSGEKDWSDAQWIGQKLGINVIQVNFVKEYWNEVFGSFLKDYQNGLTPNPDILCNRHIKFNYFFNYARTNLNADAIATGHYARHSFGPYLEQFNENTNAKLLKAADEFKDQTFFLSQIPQNALKRTLFPLGDLNKHEVKRIAEENNLIRVAKKKESTGICFIGDREFKEFISEYIDKTPGKFVCIDTGKIIGIHEGLHHWTVGQRCRIAGCLKPYFIVRKDLTNNTIYVCPGTNHPSLYTDIVYTASPYWIDCTPFSKHETIIECEFRFQHTKPLVKCKIFQLLNGNLFIKLNKALRAITPGQSAAFYCGKECLGNAKITAPGPSFQNLENSMLISKKINLPCVESVNQIFAPCQNDRT